MDFAKNIKTGLSRFPLGKMDKKEKFLAVSAFVAKGSKDEIKLSDIGKKGVWNKGLLGIPFAYRYYYAAVKEGWVEPADRQGYFIVMGYDHLSGLLEEISSKEIRKTGKLVIFSSKATSTFDTYIKKILKSAKQRVLIVDSYISGALFDDILREIPKSVSVKMVYGKIDDSTIFITKYGRFKKEWQKFNIKENKSIHDRFLVIDNTGYFLGPSLKDAADRSPSALVALEQGETKLLADFFDELWKSGK